MQPLINNLNKSRATSVLIRHFQYCQSNKIVIGYELKIRAKPAIYALRELIIVNCELIIVNY